MLRKFRARSIAFIAILVTSCGGGGGGSDAVNSNAPVARFSSDPQTGNAPLTVNFDASASTDSNGSISSYRWNFGDGGAEGEGEQTRHTYQSGGIYTARLTVTDNDDMSTSASATIDVNTLPQAQFTFDPETGSAPLTVSFDGSESADMDGSIVTYRWDFGDSSESSQGVRVQHRYEMGGSGSYDVRLTVTDDDNATASRTIQLIVNEPPAARIMAAPETGNAPLSVVFDGSDSTDIDGQIMEHEWDFGDGSGPVVGPIVEHVYMNPGSYSVRLSVTDDDQASAQIFMPMTVNQSAGLHSLSGTIRILSSSAYDSDVNDVFAPFLSNNTSLTAQEIPNPATLGGYINVPFSGALGELYESGDDADIYRVVLRGDENILLFISDFEFGDLDLFLYDENFTLVDASLGVGNTESILSGNSGIHHIEVRPFSGSSNYVLNLGRNINNLGVSQARLSDDFVPGEIITKRRAGLKRYLAGKRHVDRYQLQKIKPFRAALTSGILEKPYPFNSLQSRLGAKITPYLQGKLNTLLAIKEQLKSDPDIVSAEPNFRVKAHEFQPNDPFYSRQWHYSAINLPDAWDDTGGSADVIVAVLDTGVLLAHPDLQAQLIDGYDFVRDITIAADGDGIDPDPNDPGDKQEEEARSSFHGTHVSGTVAASSNNGVGVAGVAGGTGAGMEDGIRIMPVRVLGKGGGFDYDICQGVLYAAGLANDSGTLPPSRADIINLSLGGPSTTSFCRHAYEQAIAAGVIVVAAAGNESNSLPSYPAALQGVISVSATAMDNSLAFYSSFGPTVDIAAPGGDLRADLDANGIPDGVMSTMGDDSHPLRVNHTYRQSQGTSMAAPHVAGVAALMKSIFPGLTPAQFESALTSMEITDDIGVPGRDDDFGYGLINARKAVNKALLLAGPDGPPADAVLQSSLTSINFGETLNQVQLLLSNGGAGPLEVTDVSTNQPWLTITAIEIDSQGLGNYSILADRSDSLLVETGNYAGEILIQSTVNNVDIPVFLRVPGPNTEANAGLHYVLLVTPDTHELVQWTVATLDQGQYHYQLDDIPAGAYKIFAGTDSDNDFFICDSGEACGTYGTLDSPGVILVNASIESVDFDSGFRISLFEQSQADFSDTSIDKISIFKPLRIGNEKPVTKGRSRP